MKLYTYIIYYYYSGGEVEGSFYNIPNPDFFNLTLAGYCRTKITKFYKSEMESVCDPHWSHFPSSETTKRFYDFIHPSLYWKEMKNKQY